jgi:transcription elongation GreA/GreB family factor
LPEINESIQVAKEHGDLRENSEYKMARQEKDRLQSRASELERGLRKAEVTDFTQVGTDVIGIGSLFDLTRASTGETSTRAILGAWDSDTEGKVIIMPYLSPLAKGLLGRKAGETVKVSVGQSAESWTVSNLRRWVDSAR